MPLHLKASHLLSLVAGCAVLGSGHAEPTKAWREPSTGMEFVWIAKGCFQMGAKEASPAPAAAHMWRKPPHPDEVPRHEVCLDGFWMARHEVTREQWGRLMQPRTPITGREAMTGITYSDAEEFGRKLSVGDNGALRLPTEAEWEYACLAGTSPKPYDEDDEEAVNQTKEVAWYADSEPRLSGVQVVGQRKANPWQLHDMLGNAWEWVQDSYAEHAYASHALYNPIHKDDGARRVIRGGSFRSSAPNIRCGGRNYGVADDRLPTIGFRLVRIEPKKK